MKRYKIFMMIASVIVVLATCVVSKEVTIKYFFASIYYGKDNSQSDIIFSRNSGFYEEEFELYIYAPTDEIYYTLDGSDPDINSLKYEKPMIIKDATINSNIHSMRVDVTTRFSEEINEEYVDLSDEPDYMVSENPVDKCNVLKVVYYDKYGNRSKIAEQIYFVGFDEKEGYENINIISVTTEPDNLFDYENGIYVTGERFDLYREEGIPEDELGAWAHWKANYRQKGKKWERESSIQIFDIERNLVLSQNVGLRIQGGASRAYYPKSLNFFARDEYGDNRLNYDFWGTGYTPKRITLTCGGNDYYTKIRDRLACELSEDTNIATMHYEPYVLFLNGEYWGFFYLTEKYDAQYVEYYYGVERGENDENIIMIKNGAIEVGTEDDKNLYDAMVYYIESHDMSIEENYRKACELIDIESFIDYFAIESYIARIGDWPESNYALWRSKNISDKPYEDGKWRWMLFDVNSKSMKSGYYDFDYIEENREESKMFDSLCENDEFKRKFSERIIELSNTIFEKEVVNQKIDEYVQLMDEPMKKHFQRFFCTDNELFHVGIEEIRFFFNEREPYIAETIEYHFGKEFLGEMVQ